MKKSDKKPSKRPAKPRPVIVRDVEQNTPEWDALRCGRVTASEMAKVCAKGHGKAPSKTRRTYLMRLAGEVITGRPADTYTNPDMERGHELEAEAIELYEFLTGNKVERVGFVYTDEAGASPDGLVARTGLVEVKTRAPHLQIELLLTNKVPNEHREQIQGQLWVTGRRWVDFVSYCPDLPLFIERVPRHDAYIAGLAMEVELFNAELRKIVDSIRQLQRNAPE